MLFLSTNLVEARKRGVPIVGVNPTPERALIRFAEPQDVVQMATFGSTPIASEFVHIGIGGDLAFLKGMMRALFEREAGGEAVLDHAFIAEHTAGRSEEHTSELQSLMRISYAVFCLKTKRIFSS